MTSTATPQIVDTAFAPLPSPSSSTDPSPSTSGTPKHHEPELPYPSPYVEDISGFPRINAGHITEHSTDSSASDIVAYPYPNATTETSSVPRTSEDPFAAQRRGDGSESNPFTVEARDRTEDAGGDVEDKARRSERACEKTRRRLSDESDASTASPTSSRIQHPKGSALATPSSRASRVEKNHGRDGNHHVTLVEKGWARMTGRSSKGEKD